MLWGEFNENVATTNEIVIGQMKWDKNFLQLTFYKTIESCIIVNNCEANFPLFSFFFVQFSSFANYVFGMTDWLVAMDIMLCIDSYCVGNRFWIIWGITVETLENNDTNFFKVFSLKVSIFSSICFWDSVEKWNSSLVFKSQQKESFAYPLSR